MGMEGKCFPSARMQDLGPGFNEELSSPVGYELGGQTIEPSAHVLSLDEVVNGTAVDSVSVLSCTPRPVGS